MEVAESDRAQLPAAAAPIDCFFFFSLSRMAKAVLQSRCLLLSRDLFFCHF